jgi:hypothetical protein
VRTSIETRRLILCPSELGDIEEAFAWFGDPIVMRFVHSSLTLLWPNLAPG